MKESDSKQKAPDQNIANAKIKDEDQPKMPFMFAIAMFLAPFSWYGPNIGARNVLLPQLFNQIDPSQKVWAVGVLSAAATITAAITVFLFGAMSDMARTRFGRRKPFIVVGTIVMAAAMILVGYMHSITAVIVVWVFAAIGENIVNAAMYPEISDRVAPKWRGTLSTFYGVGVTGAQQGFAIIAAKFLGNVQFGLYALAGTSVVICIIHLILANEKSNLDEPPVQIDKITMIKHFSFPTKGARDFYLALFGKFFMNVGYTTILTYLLYIFTDYMHLDDGKAGASVAIFSTISLISGVFFAIVSGPLADKLKRIKGTIVVSTIVLALAPFVPLLIVKPWAMFIYAFFAAVGIGVYNSVDGALSLNVLPSSDTAGKDLGLINLANTISQVFGAIVASAVVSMWGYSTIFVLAIIVETIAAFLIGAIRSVR